jgi:hypothetical protein
MRYFSTSQNEQVVIVLMIVMVGRFYCSLRSNIMNSEFLYAVVDFVESITANDDHWSTIYGGIK